MPNGSFTLLVLENFLEMLSWNEEVNPFEIRYHDGLSLRQLAGKFGVSYETVRRTLGVVQV